jgi:hypothetical protein
MTALTAAEARRLAVAVTIAAHDGDRDRLAQLLDGVPVPELHRLVEHLAHLADEGLRVAAGSPDDGRRVLCDVALDLAADLARLCCRAIPARNARAPAISAPTPTLNIPPARKGRRGDPGAIQRQPCFSTFCGAVDCSSSCPTETPMPLSAGMQFSAPRWALCGHKRQDDAPQAGTHGSVEFTTRIL